MKNRAKKSTKPDSQPLISTQYLILLQRYLSKQKQLNNDTLGDLDQLFKSHDKLIPTQLFLEQVERAITETGEPLLPLFMGQQIHPADYGILGGVMLNSETLKEANEFSLQYEQRLINHCLKNEHINTDDYHINRISILGLNEQQSRILAELDFSSAFYMAHFLTQTSPSNDGRLKEIHFQHQPYDDVARYESFFHTSVQFNQKHNQMFIPHEHMETSCFLPEENIQKKLIDEINSKTLPATPSSTLPTANNIGVKVHEYVAAHFGDDSFSLESTAQFFNLSISTLKRQLKQEGLSFQNIHSNVRSLEAKQLLKKESMPIQEIARYLGFKDQTTFCRAFKQWTGITPLQYRKSSL